MSPGRIDRGTVRRHLLALDEVLTQLALHAGKSAELLRTSTDERWAVERGLQLCTQSVLDIATHLVASAGRDAPDYASAIDELGRLGILPTDLALKLRPLAAFRNALVHGYLGLNIEVMHGVLNQHLDEVRAFTRHVEAHLASQSPT